jgi:hypothetical protein
VGAIVGLTQNQVVQLIAAIRASIQVISQISVVVTLIVTDLTPDIRAFFDAEIQAVREILNPFIVPLAIFAAAILRASVTLGVVVTGLRAALIALLEIQLALIAGIGVPVDPSLPVVSAIAAL